MRTSRPSLIAYYYFDFKDAFKRGVRGLLTSLLFQLVDDSDRCSDVHHVFMNCTPRVVMAVNSPEISPLQDV